MHRRAYVTMSAMCACSLLAQVAFDPDYKTLPLEVFEPMVRRMFAREPYWHPDHKAEIINRAKIRIANGYPDS